MKLSATERERLRRLALVRAQEVMAQLYRPTTCEERQQAAIRLGRLDLIEQSQIELLPESRL